MRRVLLGLCFVVLAPPAKADEPAPTTQPVAVDFTKYVPENADFYVHVNVPKLFASPLVRKAVRMAIEKHQNDLLGLLPFLENLGPGMPKPTEEQAKQVIKDLSDAQQIGQLFDSAKDLLTDVVVTGQGEANRPDFVVLIKCHFITVDAMELAVGFAGNNPQVKLKKLGKDKQPIYQLATPLGTIYLTVPEAGLMQVAMSEARAEASFAAKGKPTHKLAALIVQKRADDFIFTANVSTNPDTADFVNAVTHMVLDKDLHLTVEIESANEEKASLLVKNMELKQEDIRQDVRQFLGEKAEGVISKIEFGKPVQKGTKTITTVKLTGDAVEAFLKK